MFEGAESGRRVEAFEQLCVVGLGRDPVGVEMLVQPLDVLAVRPALDELGDLALSDGVVGA